MSPNQGTKSAAAEEAGGDAKRRKEEANGSAIAPTDKPQVEDDASSDISDAVDSDIEKIIARARGHDVDSDNEGKAEAGKKDDSDSSSDSSSSSSSSTMSSSSSSSSVEEEAEQDTYSRIDDGEEERGSDEEPEEPLTPDEQIKKDLEACRNAQLTRKQILNMLHQLPPEESYRGIKSAWVRITLQVGMCVVAQIKDLVDAEPYSVDKTANGASTVKVSLKCRRCMPPERNYKLIYVSNQEITEEEFKQWVKLTQHHGMELDQYRSHWHHKAKEIQQAKDFKFDENAVNQILRRKAQHGIDTEFAAQKESRMRSDIQAALSQMVLCGLKETRAADLEQRGDQAQSQMALLHQKAAQHQDQWFENRPNLYGVKEINMKNKTRQIARDKHALNFTYAMEEEADEAEKNGKVKYSNPFERRACRPVSAWDTKLTSTEGIESGDNTRQAGDDPKAAAGGKDVSRPNLEVFGVSVAAVDAPTAASAPTATTAPKAAGSKLDMRAHRHLWSIISGGRGLAVKEPPSATAASIRPLSNGLKAVKT